MEFGVVLNKPEVDFGVKGRKTLDFGVRGAKADDFPDGAAVADAVWIGALPLRVADIDIEDIVAT